MGGHPRLLDFLFEFSGDGIIVCDEGLRPLRVNQAVEVLTGHAAADLLAGATPAATAARDQLAAAIKAGGVPYWSGMLTCADRRDRRFDVLPTTIEAAPCAPLTMVAFLRPSRGELPGRDQAFGYDPLTGLPNHVIFLDRVERALLQANRAGGSVALLTLGLDRFLLVNEALGFAAGDRLLVEVAQRLTECVREIDTVVRLEGDRFALVMALADQDDSVIVAEKVLTALKIPFSLDGQEVALTSSLGIGMFPQDARDGASLIKCSDTALHHAKLSGRNQYQFFSEELNRRARARLDLEARMRRALANDEFVVYFQPKVRAADAAIVGAEALIRWNDPAEGLIRPADFIAVAEETGMIEEIGAWVLRHSCRLNKSWQERRLPSIGISVNVSARQFRNRHFVDTVRQALSDSCLDPRWLELEITESMLMGDVDAAVIRMNALRQLGVGLSIDDFGTGYSSLSYLSRFPITTLKIDRAFVVDVDTNPKAAEIARAIIGLSKGLNLDVVAEGCELPAHVKFLTDQGCHTIQGFYFSRPLPAAEFEQLLEIGVLAAPVQTP